MVYNINKEIEEFQRMLQRHHNCYKWIGLHGQHLKLIHGINNKKIDINWTKQR